LSLYETFITYLSSEKNYSSHTLAAYKTDLKQFESWLKANYTLDSSNAAEVQQIKHRMLRQWMGNLLEEGLSKKSLARKVSALSAFFKFLRRNGILEVNPAQHLSIQPQQPTSIEILCFYRQLQSKIISAPKVQSYPRYFVLP
jgi:integrase/recombinase XerC